MQIPGDTGLLQRQVAHHGICSGIPKQPYIAGLWPLDVQVANAMPQALKDAAKVVTDTRNAGADGGKPGAIIPVMGIRGINVLTQHIVLITQRRMGNGLQGGAFRQIIVMPGFAEFSNHRVLAFSAIAAQLGGKGAGGRQRHRLMDVICRRIVAGYARLPIFQRQPCPLKGRHGGIDMNILPGTQGQRIGRPGHAIFYHNVAMPGCRTAIRARHPATHNTGIQGLNGHIRAGQGCRERSPGNIPTAGGNGEILRVNQPGAGFALWRGGGNHRIRGNTDLCR